MVHSFYSTAQPSGENVTVENQFQALVDAGHTVKLFSRHTDDTRAGASYNLRAAGRVAFGVGTSPLDDILRFKPDVVHIHNLFPNFGTSWTDDLRSPLILTLHNFRPLCAAATLYRDGAPCTECITRGSHRGIRHGCYRGSRVATVPVAISTRKGGPARNLLARANRIVALSQRTAATYKSLVPQVDPSRISIVPNFVQGGAASPTTSDYWLYAGRLASEKGVQTLIRYWPDSERLVVVGDGPLRSEIERASAGRNISIVGARDHATTLHLIRGARGMMFPSEWAEPAAAQTYVEALASGVPTISWDGNAVADDIRLARSGVISRPTELKPALDHVRANREEFAICALRRYNEEFTQEVWTGRIMNVYREAVASA